MESPASTSSSPLILKIDTECQQLVFSEDKKIGYIIDENGKVWFPATDAAKLLEYGNPRRAIMVHVEDSHPEYVVTMSEILKCQRSTKMVLPCQSGYVRPNRRRAAGTLSQNDAKKKYISESGFYTLTLNSKMSAAIRFQKWVYEEVLPEIRKSGSYSMIKKASVPSTSSGPIPKSELQTRLDSIEINKYKSFLIKENIPNATCRDYAELNNHCNTISLGIVGTTTKMIKRQRDIPDRMSLAQVMNPDALTKKIFIEMLFNDMIMKMKDDMETMNADEKTELYNSYAETIRPLVNSAFIRDTSDLIPVKSGRKRTRELNDARRQGKIEPSPHIAAITKSITAAGEAAGGGGEEEKEEFVMPPEYHP